MDVAYFGPDVPVLQRHLGPRWLDDGFGAGCPRPAGLPSLSMASPIPGGIGDTLTLRLSGFRLSRGAVRVLRARRLAPAAEQLVAAVAAGAAALPSCSLWVSPAVVVPVAVQGGAADLTVPIRSPLRFCVQGLLSHPLVPGTGGFSLASATSVDANP